MAGTEFASDEIGSVLRWWRDAGVDMLVDDEPRRWLQAARSDGAKPTQVEAAAPPQAPANNLAALLHWLRDPANLPELGPHRLVSGPADAQLMILVDMPERADIDAGSLVAGDVAEVFEAMLAAIGQTRETVYLTSMLPGRTVDGRLSPQLAETAAALTRRHVRLAAPEKLWLLGDATSRALLGINAAGAAGRLHILELDGLTISTIATAHPKVLANDPERKHRKRMWKEMQRLMGLAS